MESLRASLGRRGRDPGSADGRSQCFQGKDRNLSVSEGNNPGREGLKALVLGWPRVLGAARIPGGGGMAGERAEVLLAQF